MGNSESASSEPIRIDRFDRRNFIRAVAAATVS